MSEKEKAHPDFGLVKRMSNAQMSKLSKDQLISVLREAINNCNAPEAGQTATPYATKDVIVEIMDNKLNSHFKLIEEMLSQTMESLKNVRSTCDSLQIQINELKEKSKSTKSISFDSDDIVNELEQRMNRRSNVVISGLAENQSGSVDERKQSDETKVKDIFRELGNHSAVVLSVARIGKPSSKRSRLVRVTLSDSEMKMSILKNSKSLRSSNSYRHIFVNNDLTFKQREEQKALRDELKTRRGNGEDVVIYKNKITRKDDIKNFQ